MQAHQRNALEQLFMDDEHEGEQRQHEQRRDGQSDDPLLVLRLLVRHPRLHRREPERQQEHAARGQLVQALVEWPEAVGPGPGAIETALEPESLQQGRA
jgi:hypothetical protein